MSRMALLAKLSFLPLRRSWLLLGFLALSLAQIDLALWLTGGVVSELHRTEAYADRSRFVTLQLRDESVLIDPIKEILAGEEISIEELKVGQVVERLEQEEPEIAQTIRSLGGEAQGGAGLVPRLVVARGPIPDTALEKLKMMTEITRVDSSPVHHNRLKKFYTHLAFEMRIALALILFLAAVQVMVFHRILRRDSSEISKNLLAWGARSGDAHLPGFGSLLILTQFAFLLSLGEWWGFRLWIWKENSFLGELSVDRDLAFPVLLCGVTAVATLGLSAVLAFSRRTEEA